MDISLSNLRELVMDRESWHAAVCGVAKIRKQLSDWTNSCQEAIIFWFHGCSHHHSDFRAQEEESVTASTFPPSICHEVMGLDAVPGYKNDRMIYLFPRQAIQHHSNSSLCLFHQSQRSWSWSILWRPRRPPRTNTKKRYSIYHWGLECKSRKSRDNWGNRQVWHWYSGSPVCGSLTWRVWDLILSWLCPSCHLAEASSVSLDMGYFFFDRFQHSPVNGYSTASCVFAAFVGGDECTSFYSARSPHCGFSLLFLNG